MENLLTASVILGVLTFVGLMLKWRMDDLQYQLSERMILYRRDFDKIDKRLIELEKRCPST